MNKDPNLRFSQCLLRCIVYKIEATDDRNILEIIAQLKSIFFSCEVNGELRTQLRSPCVRPLNDIQA
jgi:hypothetical protein